MKRSILAAVLAVSATGVQAADLGGQRIAVPSAILATGHDWTGFYAGLHAGYGWGNTSFDPLMGIPNTRTSGALIGGQFGWNYQVGQFVLGLEGTLAWASLSGSVSDALGFGATIHSKTNWIATLGPRLGFAFDRALIYAKGGFAIAGFQSRIDNGGGLAASGSHAQAGWFVGGGVEYALTPNWSAKVEYNYINLGSGFAQFDIAPGSQGLRSSRDIHTITLGFNYLFPVSRQAAARAASLDAAGGFNWTGFYLGAHAGYGWGSTTFDAALGGLAPNHGHNGVLLGGQFGWNYQINRAVLGLEATAAWAGLSGSATSVVGTFRTRVNWLATMGPRVGFTVLDRALIYAKGGVAFAGFNTDGELLGPTSGSTSNARIGWFVGGGAEYAFAPNWSAKVEYSYHNFSAGNWLVSSGPIAFGLRAKEDVHSVTVGVNYLFTTGPGAVVARY
ncbi:outer membrane protein [Phreatobacter stygius]|uniref:outer membrane protein n=1 Tax=Phreatobacter stygius TaxID=1940610 RepID=UPI001476E89F|nr:outer membrane protein [Phreatobacter stygius]